MSVPRRRVRIPRWIPGIEIYLGSEMQQTYAAWLGHARDCGKCRDSASHQKGCGVGKELWKAHRTARRATSIDKGKRSK